MLGLVIFLLVLFGIVALLGGAIARKAGFSGWWGVTLAVPFVNLIMIWVLAFVEWREPRPPLGKKEEKIISAWD